MFVLPQTLTTQKTRVLPQDPGPSWINAVVAPRCGTNHRATKGGKPRDQWLEGGLELHADPAPGARLPQRVPDLGHVARDDGRVDLPGYIARPIYRDPGT